MILYAISTVLPFTDYRKQNYVHIFFLLWKWNSNSRAFNGFYHILLLFPLWTDSIGHFHSSYDLITVENLRCHHQLTLSLIVSTALLSLFTQFPFAGAIPAKKKAIKCKTKWKKSRIINYTIDLEWFRGSSSNYTVQHFPAHYLSSSA